MRRLRISLGSAALAAAVAAWTPAPPPAVAQAADTPAAAARQSPVVPPADTSGPRAARGGAELEALTREVASQLRCPVCQGESIQDSPAGLAQDMRAVVRDQLAAGRTPEEVKAYFVGRYGEWILLQPTARGLNVLVYALPFLVLLAGASVVVFAVRRWTSRAAPSLDVVGAAAPAPDDAGPGVAVSAGTATGGPARTPGG